MNFSTLYQGFLFVVLILVSISTIATAAPVPEIIVTDYTLQSKKRVSRTEFEFVYSITVENTASSSFSDIEGTVTVNSGVYSLVDQNLYIPSIEPFEVISNAGQFTILVDRRFEFDPSGLGFSFETQSNGSFFSKNQKLVGSPEDLAVNVIENVFNFQGAPKIIKDFVPGEGYVVRTRLSIEVGETATVADFNALLSQIDGKIVTAIADTNELTISIPDPGSFSNLSTLKNNILSNSWIEGVYYNRPVPSPKALPKDYPFQLEPPQELDQISHQLAIKSHGMWNIKDVLDNNDGNLHYVVIDHFGNGEPLSGENGNSITVGNDTLIYEENPDSHGYQVLGITLGSFGDGGGPLNNGGPITGTYPNDLPVSIIDMSDDIYSMDSLDQYTAALIKALSNSGKNVVLNTSLGYCLTPGTPDEPCLENTPAVIERYIKNSAWIRAIKDIMELDKGFENEYIHVVAAGNDGQSQYPAFFHATKNSDYASLATEYSNILVVENREKSEGLPTKPPQPKCLNPSSTLATDMSPNQPSVGLPLKNGISAIGTNVYSFACGIGASSNNPSLCADLIIQESGTSFAAPQVSGAALAVWAANPKLGATEVVDILIQHAKELPEDKNCQFGWPEPVLDVYSSVLSADKDMKLRLALLDVSNENWDGQEEEIISDGNFGLGDIRRFVTEYLSRYNLLKDNFNFDYSRFDLNADGKTGGKLVTDPAQFYSFDLNANGVIDDIVSPVSQIIEGVTVYFDEENVLDEQILCYYAYSDLLLNLSDEEKVERTIIMLPILDRCGVDLTSIEISIGSPSIWNTPTVMTLSYNPGSLFETAKVWPFNWYGEGSCGSEQGGGFLTGVWSEQVESGALFMPVTKVEHHPAPVGANRIPCSSFFAVKDGRVWFNATARRYSISGFFASDREYQVRYFSDPQYSSDISPKVARTNTGTLSLGTVNSVPFGSYGEQQSISQPDVEFEFKFEPK